MPGADVLYPSSLSPLDAPVAIDVQSTQQSSSHRTLNNRENVVLEKHQRATG